MKQTDRCHPEESRPFTTREYARIQSFPDDWQFAGNMNEIYKQIGNAVPVELAKEVGTSIISALNKQNNEDSNSIMLGSEIYEQLGLKVY